MTKPMYFVNDTSLFTAEGQYFVCKTFITTTSMLFQRNIKV